MNNLKMILTNTEGESVRDFSKSLNANSIKELAEFLKQNSTTAGYSIQYLTDGNKVIQLVKKGKVCQKDLKTLWEKGFKTACFSWAWAPKKFLLNDQKVELSVVLNGVTLEDALKWKGLLY